MKSNPSTKATAKLPKTSAAFAHSPRNTASQTWPSSISKNCTINNSLKKLSCSTMECTNTSPPTNPQSPISSASSTNSTTNPMTSIYSNPPKISTKYSSAPSCRNSKSAVTTTPQSTKSSSILKTSPFPSTTTTS